MLGLFIKFAAISFACAVATIGIFSLITHIPSQSDRRQLANCSLDAQKIMYLAYFLDLVPGVTLLLFAIFLMLLSKF